jgi:hypothetical protein
MHGTTATMNVDEITTAVVGMVAIMVAIWDTDTEMLTVIVTIAGSKPDDIAVHHCNGGFI